MVTCKEIADHKSMPFIQLVGDQPVYTFLTELKSENTHKFVKIVPVLGCFHLEMAFMNTIYKRINGCGLSDLVVAAGIIEQGSVEKALSGGHYKRCMRIHKLVYECLARRMIKNYVEHESDISELSRLSESFKSEINWERRNKLLEEVCSHEEFRTLLQQGFTRIENSDSEFGKFFVSYMNMVEILFLNYSSSRTQNWGNYLVSLQLMLPWMASYNNIHYSRYLPVYWASMKNLSDSQREWMRDSNFSFSLTGKPFTCIPPDQVIEMTMNKGSKGKGGWIGITKNLSQVNTHCLTINTFNEAKETLKSFADITRNTSDHPENCKY